MDLLRIVHRDGFIVARCSQPNELATLTVEILRASSSDARRTTIAIKRNASGLERRVNRFCIFRGKSDFDVLLAEFFLDERDGVVARRQALDFELAVGAGDREERTLGYVDEHAHPRMLVALHGQHDFFTGKSFLERSGLRRLRLVPLA